jgi:NAD+ kinase
MKIAIYGQTIAPENIAYLKSLFNWLNTHNVKVTIYKPYSDYLLKEFQLDTQYPAYSKDSDLESDVDCMISIGGDGTILNTMLLVKDSGIPVIGLNTGRLGFLSSVPKENMEVALTQLLDRKYTLEPRVLLDVDAGNDILETEKLALNDATVLKKDTASMISIHTWLNGEFFTTYWADGLIISTPTGSTGYSLSCGGPIILPTSQSFVLTPIAPHNLNMRPVIVPDTTHIKLVIESRQESNLISLDSRSYTLKTGTEIHIKKAKFAVNLIKMPNISYIETLRNKLLWGVDKRN